MSYVSLVRFGGYFRNVKIVRNVGNVGFVRYVRNVGFVWFGVRGCERVSLVSASSVNSYLRV